MSAPFISGLEGWDKSRFEAYAKLLRLKNGGQIEEADDYTELADEQMELSDLDSPNSVNVKLLSRFNENKLKRAFLDRLSELVANEKGGRFVSASLMIEWPDRVDVLVAKNTGFTKKDQAVHFLKTIASGLRDISRLDRRDPCAIHTIQELWTSLIRSYEPRIKIYIIEARQAFKKTKTSLKAPGYVASSALHDRQSSLLLLLEDLRVLLSDVPRLSTQEGLDEAVQNAYDICYLYNEQEFESIANHVSNARSLRNALSFLGRLKKCFKTLIRGAERLSNFQNLRILPVTMLPARGGKGNSTGDWSVAQAFSSLGLSLNDQTVKAIFASGKRKGSWTKSKLLLNFDKLKSCVFEVHAEVQVALAATRHECKGASTFKYVGCSKRSCFLCSRFVERYGQFKTRGCHGKIYDLWTLPQLPWLAEADRLSLVQILGDLEKDMRDSIQNKKAVNIPPAQESTIGGSSLATIRQHFDNPYVMSLVWQRLEAQRGDTLLGTRKEDNVGSSSFPSEGQYDTAGDQFLPEQRRNQSPRIMPTSMIARGECLTCERETYRHCVHCNRDWFCSEKCQDQMSLDHLAKCSARPLTAADILFDDIIKDQFPKDEQTREDFGFNRCSHWREESYLLGLYKGLLYMQDPEISPVKLSEWQRKGLLARRIIEKFSALPQDRWGDYFPWFLQNQHILDGSTRSLQINGRVNPLLRALEAAKPYLELEDRSKDLCELEPPEKRFCFIFYSLALDSAIPNPNWLELDLWYDFGFALCTDEYHERTLGALYSRLVGGNKFFRDCDESLGFVPKNVSNPSTCSFDEFWRAWQKGRTAELFDSYGMGDALDGRTGSWFEDKLGVSQLREFMSYPVEKEGLRPSVWRLKHLLALEDNTPLGGFPKVEAAAQDYGFTPQLDARTKMELRRFYRQLFEMGDPLEIHKAKERGELLEYARSFVKDINDRVRDVLQNMDSTQSND